MFKSDQPIKSYKKDILGRYPFAQSLGDANLKYKEKDCIVIGLLGAWGSGKTSIINMTVEYIKSVSKNEDTEKRPIVVRFNPWNFSDQNQLITQFFKQLSAGLERSDHTDTIKNVGKKLKIYAKFFEPLKLFPGIGQYAGFIKDALQNIGAFAESLADLKSNDLNTVRSELDRLLWNQTRKIIIVIDDIDRLNDIEIRQIFQLIKSLADFPNTIYLLAFDREVVINALNRVQDNFGKEYLEKIVQVPFEVPLLSKHEIEDLLFNQIAELVPENKWNNARWFGIYHNSIKYFFRNIRDIARYINSLRFNFGLVKEEVNPIDFFAITAIQVFIPVIYYEIRNNKNLFAPPHWEQILREGIVTLENKQQERKPYEEIIMKVNEFLQEPLTELLKELFPCFSSIYYGNRNIRYNSRKNKQICNPDVFDIYFKLSLPKEEISEKEIKSILLLADTPDSFAEALLELNEDGRLRKFLKRLEDYIDDIPEENTKSVIMVLMDIGDLSSKDNLVIFNLFKQLNYRSDSQEKRFNILKNAIEKAENSLYTIVYEVHSLGDEYGKYSSERTEFEKELTVNAEHLKNLEELACKKIESWAEDRKLLKCRDLKFILFMWKEWGENDKVVKFVKNVIETDNGLIDLIASFLSYVGMGDTAITHTHWRIHLDEIGKFLDLIEIEPRMRIIFSSPDFKHMDDRSKLAVNTLLDTIDGKIKDS
jgi:predicted KAP-like P-loop ATPase